MNTMDRELLTEWLDLDLDGGLGADEKARLAERLDASGLAAERSRLEALHALIRDSKIEVRDGFANEVLAALPTPAWQPGRVPVWALPVAMMVVLGFAAAFVLGSGSPLATVAEGPVAGTGLAVFDFLKVTALAGAGLVAASWRGFGWGLEELIASSGLSLVALAVMVLFLDLLFLSMLRRRPNEIQPILERVGSGDSPSPEA